MSYWHKLWSLFILACNTWNYQPRWATYYIMDGVKNKPTSACTCKIFSTIINLFDRPIIDMDKQWKPFKLYCSCWSLILWEQKCSGPHTRCVRSLRINMILKGGHQFSSSACLFGNGGFLVGRMWWVIYPVKKSLQSKDSKPTTYQTICKSRHGGVWTCAHLFIYLFLNLIWWHYTYRKIFIFLNKNNYQIILSDISRT